MAKWLHQKLSFIRIAVMVSVLVAVMIPVLTLDLNALIVGTWSLILGNPMLAALGYIPFLPMIAYSGQEHLLQLYDEIDHSEFSTILHKRSTFRLAQAGWLKSVKTEIWQETPFDGNVNFASIAGHRQQLYVSEGGDDAIPITEKLLENMDTADNAAQRISPVPMHIFHVSATPVQAESYLVMKTRYGGAGNYIKAGQDLIVILSIVDDSTPTAGNLHVKMIFEYEIACMKHGGKMAGSPSKDSVPWVIIAGRFPGQNSSLDWTPWQDGSV